MSSAGTPNTTGGTGATANPAVATAVAPTPAGLINSTPPVTTPAPTTTTANTGLGAPVTSYTPAQAATTNAKATATQVPTDATVSSQLQSIIASGSPLMQQATANANEQMNQRGLINSSTAVSAGENALIAAATPIAEQNAATYATAAQDTAAAQNAAALQNSSLATQTSQYNAGQTNAALSASAAAANTVAQTAETIAGNTNIQNLTDATNTAIAQLQANTNLTTAQIQAATSQIVANIQANTSITDQQAQDLTNTTIAQMNNTASLQQIQAQGTINTQIAQINDQYQQLTNSDQAAQTFYSQSLTNLANIASDTNLSAEQKTQALNDGVTELNDGLAAIAQISNTPDVSTGLNFSDSGTDATTGALT